MCEKLKLDMRGGLVVTNVSNILRIADDDNYSFEHV